MALATRFYVPTIEFVTINSAPASSPFTTDRPGKETLDNNLDSYGRSAFSSTHTLFYKTTGHPGGLTYNFAGIWAHNYDDFPAVPSASNMGILVDTAAAFTSSTSLGSVTLDPVNTLPLAVHTFASRTEQYVGIQLGNLGFVPETSLAMIGTYIDLNDVQWDWGHPEGKYKFNNQSEELPGGRVVVRNMSSGNTRKWRRRYEFITTAQRDIIRGVHQLARGTFQPFIIQDGTDTIKNAKLVRFTSDQLPDETPVVNGLWNVEFEVIEVPYIPDGFAY